MSMDGRRYRDRALALVAMGALHASALGLLAAPARAELGERFALCARELLDAGISRERAAAACGAARTPQDLSLCAREIAARTPLAAEAALSACERVRRPLELASCAVEIHEATEVADSQAVLDRCRRSLLPLRLSECTVGLARATDASPASAMARCSEAPSARQADAPAQ